MIENANIPQPIAEDYQIQHYPKPQVPSEEDVNNVLEWMDQKGLLKPVGISDLVRDILKNR